MESAARAGLTAPNPARDLARHIPGAELVLLPGDDHLIRCGQTDAVLDPVLRFVARHGPARRTQDPQQD